MDENEDERRLIAFLNNTGLGVKIESTDVINSALYAWSTLPVSHNPTMTRCFIQDFAASLDRKHFFQSYEQLQEFWDLAGKRVQGMHELSKVGAALTVSRREVKEI